MFWSNTYREPSKESSEVQASAVPFPDYFQLPASTFQSLACPSFSFTGVLVVCDHVLVTSTVDRLQVFTRTPLFTRTRLALVSSANSVMKEGVTGERLDSLLY